MPVPFYRLDGDGSFRESLLSRVPNGHLFRVLRRRGSYHHLLRRQKPKVLRGLRQIGKGEFIHDL